MDKIPCAVIGAGWWGTTAHIPALLRHPRAQLLALQHHDPAQAERTSRDFGVPHRWTSARRVLDIPGLCAVVISSTPNLHFRQAKAALERDLHVLIEKPMCISSANALELVALAARRRRHLLLSAPWHYTPHAVEAKALVGRGALGKLKMISILMTNFSAGLYRAESWKQLHRNKIKANEVPEPYTVPGRTSYSDPRIAGGGQIYCQVSHLAAYVSFLTNRQPSEVFARFDNAGAAVDVFNSLSLRLDDGTLVSLASHGAPMPSDRQCEVRVYGSRGMLLMDLWKGTMEFHDQRGAVQRYRPLKPAQVYPLYDPTTNFIDTVAGTEQNGSPARHGAVAIQVIEAACRSARTGRNVKIAPALRAMKRA